MHLAEAFLLASLPLAWGSNCTFQDNTDFDIGTGGPSFSSPSPEDCCSQCAQAGIAYCWVGVFDSETQMCWFKTEAQAAFPTFNPYATACWPPGSHPTPPPPSPPYNLSVISLPDTPVISFLGNSTQWPQSFNPAFVEPSAGTGGKRGLLVRSQNCTGWSPGECIGCNVNAQHPIAPWFPGSVITFAQQQADGLFSEPYLVFAPEANQVKHAFGAHGVT